SPNPSSVTILRPAHVSFSRARTGGSDCAWHGSARVRNNSRTGSLKREQLDLACTKFIRKALPASTIEILIGQMIRQWSIVGNPEVRGPFRMAGHPCTIASQRRFTQALEFRDKAKMRS